MGEKAEILKVRLADFLSGFDKQKIFFREKHALDDKFFINDVTHSVTNTSDFAVSDAVKKYANEFWDKTRYSAFYGMDLDGFLIRHRVQNVGIVGIETHTSVLFTAEELRNRGYEVSVVEPCVMSRDDYLHGYAISLMKNFLGVRIING